MSAVACPHLEGCVARCGLCSQSEPFQFPSLSRAQIEQFEREYFPYLFDICHTEVRPKPLILQKLWEKCCD